MVKKRALKSVAFVAVLLFVFWALAPVPTRAIGIVLDELPSTNGGIYIADVYQNSPAFKAGLKKGDHLIKIDGKKITSVGNFIMTIKNTPSEQLAVNIEFYRGAGALQEVRVELVDSKTIEDIIVQ